MPDILPSFYNAGNATVAAGGTAVTGIGTLWAGNVYPGDLWGTHKGVGVRILSVNSNTSITLAYPWTGPAQTAAAYEIGITADTARMQGTTREMLEQLKNGVLSAFSGLAGAADKIGYFTGAGTMALTSLTAFARARLADTTAAQAYAGLGVIPDGSLPDRLKYLGSRGAEYPLVDCDSFRENGWRYINNTTLNIPTGFPGGMLLAMSQEGNQTIQIAWSKTNLKTHIRVRPASPPWGAWREIPSDVSALWLSILALTTTAASRSALGITATGDSVVTAANVGAARTAIGAAALAGAAFTGDVSTTGLLSAKASILIGGSANGKHYWYNSSNVYVGEIGVGVVSGFGNSIGFYNNVGGHWNFNNNVIIYGSISKGSGTFLIDHPLDPENRDLAHGFVESPRYELIYRGTARLVGGHAIVDIDDTSDMTTGTFAALTTNAIVTALQNQDGFARLKPSPIVDGAFEITCEDASSTDLISWVVIAERNDAFVKHMDDNCDAEGRFIPEREKEDA
ncbi:hypothetical protein GA830_12250 [Mesorhizobium sp. NBSH29]|uniref:hypothetical protein n=1 Tax=Mesorhizobium sp. NBSH29 TaxID=2654249 RepID=UPI0018963F7B|nr:hypothetical protein [Mesorhizobium sp. NBSH29]QPC87429.1 hypothetical protein GA830_12250 [Mesorhizobium sp. NBSH29]